MRHILRAGKHLLELIGEVLDLAKVEAGRIGISPEHVDLLALVRESLDLLAPVASQRGVTLEPLQGETTYVLADRTRLKQVLANLLSNAIKYNCTHGWVRVEMRERGGAKCRSPCATADAASPTSSRRGCSSLSSASAPRSWASKARASGSRSASGSSS